MRSNIKWFNQTPQAPPPLLPSGRGLTSVGGALSNMRRSFWGLTLVKKTSKARPVATMAWNRDSLSWQV